ncbi:MAG: hypothetical protein JWO36_404 [Myxococcales bacterium]|nr:hypothetical protein [Myxococcales bacterium]
MQRALCALALAASACGGRYGGTPIARPGTAAAPSGGIEGAALPYQILDARTGRQIDTAAFWEQLASKHAVCVGEEHSNPHHHWMQLEIVRHLAKQWPELALGMEMFQRPFQGVLDDYAAKRISADALRSRTGYEERWGYDFNFYGPTIDAVVAGHGVLLALNAPKELTKKIAHHGLESLTATEKSQVPELELHDSAHRAWFDDLMETMGGSSAHSMKKPDAPAPADSKPDAAKHDEGDEAPEMPSADRIYTVQVTWDETMADTAVKWLRATPNGRIVILAGTGHCHDSAIVNRIKRRGISDVVSVRSVVDDGEGGVAEVLAKPANDYLVVLELSADAKAKLKEKAKAAE